MHIDTTILILKVGKEYYVDVIEHEFMAAIVDESDVDAIATHKKNATDKQQVTSSLEVAYIFAKGAQYLHEKVTHYKSEYGIRIFDVDDDV